jgi:tight adherence protein C
MVLVLIIGVVLAGIAVALLGRVLIFPRLRAAETVAQITTYGFDARARLPRPDASAEPAQPPLTRAMNALADVVGRNLRGRVPGVDESEIRRLLLAAGMYTTAPAKIIGYQVVGAVALPLLWLWYCINAGTANIFIVLGMIVLVVIGWLAPLRVLKIRGERRLDQIDYEMPEFIDTLVTTVEAGIAFAASVQIAARRFRGPLAEELRLMLQEQNMGLGIHDALEHLLSRADTPAVRSFVRAIVQGELLGVSIGQTLRSLSLEMRKRRRQRAEERAHKAPVKILFPLVFLLFPAIFIVLLGPAVFRIHDIFHSS